MNGNYIADAFVFLSGDGSGLRQSQLVQWYLEEIESDIDSEAELLEKKTLVEKVIYRLIHHVSSVRCVVIFLFSACGFVNSFVANLQSQHSHCNVHCYLTSIRFRSMTISVELYHSALLPQMSLSKCKWDVN